MIELLLFVCIVVLAVALYAVIREEGRIGERYLLTVVVMREQRIEDVWITSTRLAEITDMDITDVRLAMFDWR